ncbi:hypothetical protein BH10ACT1_BH10ACT1_08110 [soil metagenome]
MDPAPETYARAPRCVFRWLRGTVLIARPGLEPNRIEGAAALTWQALAEPGTAAEVEERIAATWIGLPPAEPGLVLESIEVLVGGGLVTAGKR